MQLDSRQTFENIPEVDELGEITRSWGVVCSLAIFSSGSSAIADNLPPLLGVAAEGVADPDKVESNLRALELRSMRLLLRRMTPVGVGLSTDAVLAGVPACVCVCV